MNRNIITTLALLLVGMVQLSAVNLVPQPSHIEEYGGHFTLPSEKIGIAAETRDLKKTALTWIESIAKRYKPGTDTTANGYIRIVSETELPDIVLTGLKNADITLSTDGSLAEEEYVLNIGKDGISIAGGTEKGVWWGLQSLSQLLVQAAEQDTWSLPLVRIQDAPHFSYRGALLDCCRYFFPVEDVKKFIDMMALHKLNVFHWHLTNDQGWRIEIRKYPKLTAIGSVRSETKIGHANDPTLGYDGTPHGGFYTQDDIREIVRYAADRQITVIPEVEMPGHALAALASYQHLGCKGEGYKVRTTWNISDEVFCIGRESTFEFLEDVLDEVCRLFPSEYIHIGGDECPVTQWETCPDCQRRMKEEGLQTERQLQGYLLKRIERHLNSKGKKIIGWDEILEGGVTPTAVVMSWRGPEGGIEAARKGNHTIMTPSNYLYLNFYQTLDHEKYGEPLNIGGRVPMEKTYSFDPFNQLTDGQKQYITGIQACVWTEYIDNIDKAQFMALPRLGAAAEIAWSEKKTSYDKFLSRMEASMKNLYEYCGYIYAPYAFMTDPESDNTVAEYDGYRLAWSDEFEGEGLPDPTVWNARDIGGVINNELQEYRKNDTRCTRVEDGKLILEAFPDKHVGSSGRKGNDAYQFLYSSGEVHTRGKVSFQYGRIDIMARIPSGKGLWPALWMMPVNRVEGKYAEIDIMEHVWSLGKKHDSIQATVHTQSTIDRKEGFTPVQAGWISSESLRDGFHLYSLIWEEDRLVVLFDNKPYFSYSKPENHSWDNWPFRQPFYLILNIAVGGSWGGETDDTYLPQRMEVEYVRYYVPEQASAAQMPSDKK